MYEHIFHITVFVIWCRLQL